MSTTPCAIRRRHARARRDRGQATVLYAVVIVLAALLLVPLVRLTIATTERADAQTVADVIALGAAHAPTGDRRRVAEDLAARNGAELRSLTVTDEALDVVEVRVVVRVGDHEAAATARRTTTWRPPTVPPRRWDPGNP